MNEPFNQVTLANPAKLKAIQDKLESGVISEEELDTILAEVDQEIAKVLKNSTVADLLNALIGVKARATGLMMLIKG